MSATLRGLVRNLTNARQSPTAVRGLVGGPPAKKIRIGSRMRTPFSVLLQNAALIPRPFYLGVDPDAAIASLKSLIALTDADVVGLSEVWDASDKASILAAVGDSYPYHRQGPPGGVVNGDGGLLLLSKYPLLTHHEMVYGDSAGEDGFKNKGILHIRTHPPDSPSDIDVFLTHTQNPDTLVPVGDPRKVLHAQLDALGGVVDSWRNPEVPALILGDLNTNADDKAAYADLLTRVGEPVDIWLAAGHPATSGATYTVENTFYANDDDRPDTDERLDYMLMKPGARFVHLVDSAEVVVHTTVQGRPLSDHFGLSAAWGELVEITRTAGL
jgi:endonuclease/exonuclease/phosphatase family metal-dependent hydrolase